MKSRLQDQTIKSAKAPRTGKTEIKDAIVPGLMLRVTKHGAKSFCLVYKVPGEGGTTKTGKPRKGKPHRFTLGTYPMMSLTDARVRARELLEQVDLGIDPRPKRLEEVRVQDVNTLAAVVKRFVIQECQGMRSADRVQRTLELHVIPTLGDRPIADIKRADIHSIIDSLVDDGRPGGPLPGAAREVIKHLHRLFDFAFDRDLIEANPAHKFKRKDIKSNGNSHRPLEDDELKAIWKAAGALGYPHGPWIKLLMLTGQRRSDWANAARSEIDTEARTHNIPAARYKTGRDHTVPLVGPAWEIVSSLPIWNEGDFLFSTNGGTVAINSAAAAKKKIAKLTGPMAKWQIHDFRVTCETRMAALGVKPDHFEAVLGHVKQGMQKVYNRHDYEAEKRAALELYSEHLMKVVGQ